MTDSSAPLVSIVIPCYNQTRFLPDAINSALRQTYRAIEVIVVDDGSRDSVNELVASYPGVCCLRQENRGRSQARNAGFEASHGEYVMFLDADDRLTPNAAEAHLRCFSTHPEAGFVVGDIDQIASDGSYIYSPRWPVLKQNFYEELLKANHLANTIGVMFRRSVFDALRGFDASLHAAEDYELLLRAARVSQSAHHSTLVAQYRRHDESTSRNGALMLQAMDRVMKMQLPILDENPELLRAWRTGERYWRDRFGAIAIRQLFNSLRRVELILALTTVFAIMRFMRGRVFVLPWKKRRQIWAAVSTLFRSGQR